MKTNKTLAQKLCLLDLVSLLSYTAALLAALCFLVLLPGCSLGEKVDREPVQTLECTRPASLSGLYPAAGPGAWICAVRPGDESLEAPGRCADGDRQL